MIDNSLSIGQIQLICLPFSGGSGFAFQPLIKHFPKSWQVFTMTYPGRGHRITEPLVYTMEQLLEDCWQQIKGKLRPPYVCLLYTSPSPRDLSTSRMPSSA